jgi:uncharacterized membrane protein YjjP (DUF1212 family)
MDGPDVADHGAHDPSAVQQLLLYLGSALTAAGEAVNEIQEHLRVVATAYGYPHARVVVVPTFVVVSLSATSPTTLEPTAQLRGSLRLDQVASVWEVLKQARRAGIDPTAARRAVLDALRRPPRFGWMVRILGHVILAVGICLILQPTWSDIALAAAFGLLVGVLRAYGSRRARVQMVMPFAASFIVTTLTFALQDVGWADADLRAMIAPLVTFLPGAALTMAVIELAAGELVTGASRLVSGMLQLTLLGFGIVAAAQVFDLPDVDELENVPINTLGWWAPWVGVLVFCVGQYLYNSAPKGTFVYLLVVLMGAWTGQYLGSLVFGGYVSGFVGALAMTPLARAVERLPGGPPSLVSFLPAFWLLVPGALGLIGLTQYLNSDPSAGLADLFSTVGAILAIALGVLCGYPIVGGVTGAIARATDLFALLGGEHPHPDDRGGPPA